MKLSIAAFLALAVSNAVGLEDENSVLRLGAPVEVEHFERVLFGEEEDDEFSFVAISDETGEELSFENPEHHRQLAGGSFRISLKCKKSYKWSKMSCSTGGKGKNNRCEDWCMAYRSCKSGADIRIRECGGSRQKWKLSGGKLQPSGCSKYCVNKRGEKLTKGKCGSFSKSSNGIKCSSSRIMSILHRPCRGEPVKCRKLSKAKKAEAASWDT